MCGEFAREARGGCPMSCSLTLFLIPPEQSLLLTLELGWSQPAPVVLLPLPSIVMGLQRCIGPHGWASSVFDAISPDPTMEKVLSLSDPQHSYLLNDYTMASLHDSDGGKMGGVLEIWRLVHCQPSINARKSGYFIFQVLI